jgi:hypothetical protein
MIPITYNEQRRAFSIWLRTGRLPSVAIADGVELKFNPLHDPADGQFTFAGSGRSYGQGGGGGFRSSGGSGGGASSREDWSREARSTNNRQRPRSGLTPTAQASGPSPRPAPNTNTQRPISNNGWGGGGFTLGGGGSFGGAGASGDWGADPSKQRTVSREPATARERQASAPLTTTARRFSAARPLHLEVRNGYEYQIDDAGQTHRVSGTSNSATSKCDRGPHKRRREVPIGGRLMMAAIISLLGSQGRPTLSTISRRMRASIAAAIERSKTNGQERSEPGRMSR